MEKYIIKPFEDSTEEIRKLFAYFLHNAPDIESVHSNCINKCEHSVILNRMLSERGFKYKVFCAPNAQIENELTKTFLFGKEICFNCKRFVCKRKKRNNGEEKETELDCLLRHIRNAIAHGRVYYCYDKRHHIIFEDVYRGKISARIICLKADLEWWKRVLSDKRYYI